MTPELERDALGDHLDRLYRAAWALCGSREDAEDLVQETYTKVLSKRRIIRTREDTLPYLLTVLRNTYISSLRTKGRRPQTAPLEDSEERLAAPAAVGPVSQLAAREVFAAIARAARRPARRARRGRRRRPQLPGGGRGAGGAGRHDHEPPLPRAQSRRRDGRAVVDLGLAGKRALVTGASGGIGQAVARELAAEGVEVVAHYHRNREAAEALGGLALGADLRDEAQVAALFEQAGPLDLCVANAGVWPSEDVPVAELAARALARHDRRQPHRDVPDRPRLRSRAGRRARRARPIGSTAGRFGEAGHADYASAKAAIGQGLLLSLKNELAPARVNVVAPGWTVSPMTEASLTDAVVEHVTATMALKKVARAEDVARTVVWLCSERAAGHVTGEVVTVAGGMEGRLLR